MIKIEPEHVVFPQKDGSTHTVSFETIAFYFELKKNNQIIKPLDPETGVFVFQNEEGQPVVYIPMGITVSNKVFPDDIMNM